MLRNLFRPPVRIPRDVADEIQSMCRASQIEALRLSPRMLQDIGLDCGCVKDDDYSRLIAGRI